MSHPCCRQIDLVDVAPPALAAFNQLAPGLESGKILLTRILGQLSLGDLGLSPRLLLLQKAENVGEAQGRRRTIGARRGKTIDRRPGEHGFDDPGKSLLSQVIGQGS